MAEASVAPRIVAHPWWQAVRVKTLPAALVPVAVGTAFAARAVRPSPALVLSCAAFALLVQIATNLANDYYDGLRGADGPARRGPVRVTAAGLVAPAAMRRAMLLALVAAALAGLPLAWARGPALVPLGAACLLAAWGYTGGPFPLAYHGLGDVFVVLFFGVVAVAGTTYALTGVLAPAALLLGLGVGLLCDDLLVVNNLRDAGTDAAVGKRTLVVRLGARASKVQYAAQVAAAYALPFAAGARAGRWGLVTLPLALAAAVRAVRARTARDFDVALGLAALTLLAYGVGLTVGLAPG